MKQLELQIMGQSYLLGCPENGDARMLDAVNRVDLALCTIRVAGQITARDRSAVLAALNLAFELPERTAGATAAAPAESARQQPEAGSPGPAGDEASSAQLASLIQRLDTALGTDGRLL